VKKIYLILLILLLVTPLFSNGQQGKLEQTEKKDEIITVFTSIVPQKYFVERIGGDRVEVHVLVGPGKNPATYEPTPGQVLKLSDSDIFFTIGVPFENAFIPKIRSSLKNLKIVDTSVGIEKRILFNEVKQVRTPDPHIWLSPNLAKVQAKTIFNALVQNDPEGKEAYTIGYNHFIKDLNKVQNELSKVLLPLKGNIFFVFHPSFGYLLDEFGLEQVAIETGGKEPGPAILEKIIMQAQEQNVKVIFVQPEFSLKSANVIAEAIGGAVVTLNPLGPDYLNNLRHIALEIEKSFK